MRCVSLVVLLALVLPESAPAQREFGGRPGFKKRPPPPPPPVTPKKIEGMPDYSIKVNVPLVNVDVLVTAKQNGQFIPGLKAAFPSARTIPGEELSDAIVMELP